MHGGSVLASKIGFEHSLLRVDVEVAVAIQVAESLLIRIGKAHVRLAW